MHHVAMGFPVGGVCALTHSFNFGDNLGSWSRSHCRGDRVWRRSRLSLGQNMAYRADTALAELSRMVEAAVGLMTLCNTPFSIVCPNQSSVCLKPSSECTGRPCDPGGLIQAKSLTSLLHRGRNRFAMCGAPSRCREHQISELAFA